MTSTSSPSPSDPVAPSASSGSSDQPLQPASPVSPGVTRRGVLIGVVIGVMAVVAAFASVHFRRTRLGRTTEFWGPAVIRTLQSSAQVRMRIPPDGALVIPPESGDDSVELADVPGVAYLRNALLDERHFQWDTLRPVPVETAVQETLQGASTDNGRGNFAAPEWVMLELAGTPPGLRDDPQGPIQPATIQLELTTGWVGLADGDRSVRLTRRVQPAVRHFLLTTTNVRSKRFDDR